MDKDEWVFFEKVNFCNKNILQYHVDTRDFHVYTNTEPSSKIPDIEKLSKSKNEFFYSEKEVIDMLHRYYNDSGGKQELNWRFFFLEGMDNWSLKYIRIYRCEFGLIVCTKDYYALRKDITSQKVGKEY